MINHGGFLTFIETNGLIFMIKDVLKFLQRQLESELGQAGQSTTDVNFPSFNAAHEMLLHKSALNLVFLNMEAEHIPQYKRPEDGGLSSRSSENHFQLYLLFVPHRSDYLERMDALSLVFRFFNANSVFDRSNSPDLPDSIQKIMVEKVELSLTDQHAMWQSLACPQQPSILYKMRVVSLDSVSEVPQITSV